MYFPLGPCASGKTNVESLRQRENGFPVTLPSVKTNGESAPAE